MKNTRRDIQNKINDFKHAKIRLNDLRYDKPYKNFIASLIITILVIPTSVVLLDKFIAYSSYAPYCYALIALLINSTTLVDSINKVKHNNSIDHVQSQFDLEVEYLEKKLDNLIEEKEIEINDIIDIKENKNVKVLKRTLH